ncbi:MAG TPA: class I SAM-dependent methyltransferase [Planctomycetota bacterium]|nr:class I SAM-dependent methyltransferase [Planctomycetota bacterium]
MGFTIQLDYAVHSRPRYGHGRPPHPKLTEILRRSRDSYADTLRRFLPYVDHLARIPVGADPSSPTRPYWNNSWFSGIDPLSLYCFLAIQNPARYLEVGSGYSTMFARQAIRDHGLRTVITSIDPCPRAGIDALCDETVRQPLEDADLSVFSGLRSGDIVFVDNSHRVFMNSDATVVFLDVIPALAPGVLIGVHDIMLPNDYPPDWGERYYSEQYVLAGYILAEGTKFDIALPSTYVGMDAKLREILAPIWSHPKLPNITPSGSSFWLRMR